jgi:predicted RNase H-like HicB family nuclease
MSRYTVLLYPAEAGGFVAHIPVFDVATEGDTVEHALEMAREAAELHINGMIEDGEPVLEEATPPIVASIVVRVPIPATA